MHGIMNVMLFRSAEVRLWSDENCVPKLLQILLQKEILLI